MSHHAHDAAAIDCGIVTVSDTRSEVDDSSGQRIRALLEAAGHRVAYYRIVKDEPAQITAVIAAAPADVHATDLFDDASAWCRVG